MEAPIFETNYKNYISQIAKLDFSTMKDTLGIQLHGQKAVIPFLGEDYFVSHTGIVDTAGNRPDYGICVILSKYLILCPEAPVTNNAWSTLKDFHKRSQFTNINVFKSDAEQPITKNFSGRLAELADACQKLNGTPNEFGRSYDLAMQFKVLPKIDILLLFNDGDDEFPATSSLLYQRQAEEYLDPESLIMIGIAFTRRLKSH